MFLARPLRDQCSSVPKSVQQSRAKVAHGLFTFAASPRHLRALMRRGFTPRSLKSASCRRKTRFSASIDRRDLAVSTSKPIKSPSRRRTMQAKAITPTSCHGFHARTQPQSRGSSFCGRQPWPLADHGLSWGRKNVHTKRVRREGAATRVVSFRPLVPSIWYSFRCQSE
jgi:hypothetical protein